MAYSNLSTQVERAVAAYLLLQGHGTPDKTFISLDTRIRTGRSRTIVVSQFIPNNPFTAQGAFNFEIQHIWDAMDDAVQPQIQSRAQMDAFIGETISAMFAQSDGNSPLVVVADAITCAGRSLAVDPNNGANPVTAEIAANNQDMVNFRMDWLKAAPVFQTRGKTELVAGFFWAEILHFQCYSSYATISN